MALDDPFLMPVEGGKVRAGRVMEGSDMANYCHLPSTVFMFRWVDVSMFRGSTHRFSNRVL